MKNIIKISLFALCIANQQMQASDNFIKSLFPIGACALAITGFQEHKPYQPGLSIIGKVRKDGLKVFTMAYVKQQQPVKITPAPLERGPAQHAATFLNVALPSVAMAYALTSSLSPSTFAAFSAALIFSGAHLLTGNNSIQDPVVSFVNATTSVALVEGSVLLALATAVATPDR